MKRKNMLSQTAWWPLNKGLVQNIGVDAALLIADLSSKQEYFEGQGATDKDGYFFNEVKVIEEDTSLSQYRQKQALDILIKLKMITVGKTKSIPPKRRFKVNVDKVNEYLNKIH